MTHLMSRAADLVIGLGVDGTGWDANSLRELAANGQPFSVRWHNIGLTMYLSQMDATVRVRIRMEAHARAPDEASRAFDFCQAAARLGQHIEALR